MSLMCNIDAPSFSVGRNHANRGCHPGLLLHPAIARVRFIVWSVGWDPGDLRSSTGGDKVKGTPGGAFAPRVRVAVALCSRGHGRPNRPDNSDNSNHLEDSDNSVISDDSDNLDNLDDLDNLDNLNNLNKLSNSNNLNN